MKKLLMFLCICTCCLTNICFAKEVEVTSDYIPILVQTKTHRTCHMRPLLAIRKVLSSYILRCLTP